MQTTLRYVLIDPNELVRDGLQAVMTREFGPAAASGGSYTDVKESGVLEAAELLAADFDEDMDARSSRIREVRAEYPSLKLLILANSYSHPEIKAAFEAGADGYQLKSVSKDLITMSVRYLLGGGLVIPLECRDYLIEEAGLADPAGARAVPGEVSRYRLSEREIDILKHFTKGASNKTIAQELELSDATVKIHVKSIFQKLGVTNRTQAAVWAWENLRDEDANRG